MSKYVLLQEKNEKYWVFLKDDKELELWRLDGSISNGDFVVEIKETRRAEEVITRRINLEVIPDE